MSGDREPRDFRMARRAYEAFFDESPQVWFDQLGHEYQMKWVRVARAVLVDSKEWRPSASKLEECQAIVDAAPHKGMRVDYKAMSKEDAKAVRTAMHYLAMQRRKG